MTPKKKKPSKDKYYVELDNGIRNFIVYGKNMKEAYKNADAVKQPGDAITLYSIKYTKVKSWKAV